MPAPAMSTTMMLSALAGGSSLVGSAGGLEAAACCNGLRCIQKRKMLCPGNGHATFFIACRLAPARVFVLCAWGCAVRAYDPGGAVARQLDIAPRQGAVCFQSAHAPKIAAPPLRLSAPRGLSFTHFLAQRHARTLHTCNELVLISLRRYYAVNQVRRGGRRCRR